MKILISQEKCFIISFSIQSHRSSGEFPARVSSIAVSITTFSGYNGMRVCGIKADRVASRFGNQRALSSGAFGGGMNDGRRLRSCRCFCPFRRGVEVDRQLIAFRPEHLIIRRKVNFKACESMRTAATEQRSLPSATITAPQQLARAFHFAFGVLVLFITHRHISMSQALWQIVVSDMTAIAGGEHRHPFEMHGPWATTAFSVFDNRTAGDQNDNECCSGQI